MKQLQMGHNQPGGTRGASQRRYGLGHEAEREGDQTRREEKLSRQRGERVQRPRVRRDTGALQVVGRATGRTLEPR